MARNAVERKQHADNQRRYRNKDPIRWQRYRADFNLRKSFGLTLDEYESIVFSQKGRCAICKTSNPKGRGVTRKFDVDHCHKTGKIRGLICTSCNRALGLVGDSIKTLKSMITYIEKYHGRN